MIGLGIVTFNRGELFGELCQSVADHLEGVIDGVWVHNDGTDLDHIGAYIDARHPILGKFGHESASYASNRGVGYAKNHVMRQMLSTGCDWLFVAEDDVIVKSPDAVLGYIAACEASGMGHLCFHAHGHHNPNALFNQGPITVWPNIVGAWCVYSRQSLLEVGLMDSEMVNAFEHVEHTMRLAKAGFCHQWPGCADATGSERWVEEQPGALENTTIPYEGRGDRMDHSRKLWSKRHPDTYQMLWGPR